MGGKVSSQEQRLSFEQKLGLFYNTDIKQHRISLLHAANRCFNFIFQLMMRFYVSSEKFLFFLDCFPPSQMIRCHFSSLCFHLLMVYWMSPLSRYFQKTSCPFQGCYWFIGLVPRLTASKLASSVEYFPVDIFYCSAVFPSNQAVSQAAHITGISKQESCCQSDNKPYNFSKFQFCLSDVSQVSH